MTSMLVLGFLCLVIAQCKEIHLDAQGLHLEAKDKPVPTYKIYKPLDKERYGTFVFEFLGLAEAYGDPLTLREETRISPKDWTLSPLLPTTKGFQFSFNYTANNGTDETLTAISIATTIAKEESGDPSMSIDLFFEGYNWQSSEPDALLVAIFRLTNTYNYTASLTIPERIQVGYSYFSVPQFAFSTLHPGSVVERVPARAYAPPTGQNYTYWITYHRFSYNGGNLEHKIRFGYGLKPTADLSTITLGTGGGVIILSFLIAMLIMFGKKLENSRYGKRFEQLTQYQT